MAENYTVNYRINVDSRPALDAIQKFQQATTQLEQLSRRFDAVSRSVGRVNSAFASINRQPINMSVNTTQAEQSLGRVIGLLGQLQGMKTKGAIPLNLRLNAPNLQKFTNTIAKTQTAINNINKRRIHPSADTAKAQSKLDLLLQTLRSIHSLRKINITGTSGATSTSSTTTTAPRQTWFRRNFGLMPNAHQYLGNVYAGTGLGMAGEFVKGMGMTYALSGLIEGVRSIFVDSAEYDNITKTTRNILATHDNGANFQQRFDEMNRLMRQVGVETKFTAPQVADAGRFLAMAGLNIDEIKSAIRPIADIALVGDTDLGETADVVTNIMTAYQIPAQKMNRVADILTSTFTSANVTLIEMAESFKYSASLFKKAGIPFEVASASLGILGDAGIKGSQAGTTMRTILSNIYNPTKKQRAAWESMGIERLDKDGNVRDILDLFMELNEKGIDIKGAYNMFHKTSAQGAVALANAVDKWNAIIADNFLSDALAQKLANEKKNTIQGLWYQITSAFTESGMQQFEKLQTPIKDFMNKALGIMQSSDFANSLHSAMSLTMTVMDSVGEMAKVILQGYSSLSSFFQGGVAVFIKAQMWLNLINGVQTMLISSFKGIQALYKIGMFANILQYLTGFGQVARRLSTLYKVNSFQSIFALITRDLKKMGAAFMSIFPKISAYMNTGWLGLLGGAKVLLPLGSFAAIAGGLWMIHSAYQKTANAANAYMESIQVINGVSMSEHATMTDKYLRIVHDKQKSANERLQEYIKLRREELGLVKSGIDTQNKQTFGEQFANEVKTYSFAWWRNLDVSGYSAYDAYRTMRSSIEAASKMLPENSPYRPMLTSSLDQFGNVQYHAFNQTFGNNIADVNRLAAAHLLFTKGANTAEGSEANLIREEFNEKFFRAKNADEIEQIWGEYRTRRQELLDRVNPKYNRIDIDQLSKLPETEWKTVDVYVQALVAQLDALMGIGNLQSENAKTLKAALALITKFSLGKEPTAEEIQSLLRLMKVEPMGTEHGLYTSPDWGAHLGYNAATGEFGNANMTARTAQENVMAVGTHIQETVKKFNPDVQAIFKPLLSKPIWGKAGAGLSISSNKRFNAVTGQLEDVNEDNPFEALNTNPLGNDNSTDNDLYKYGYNSTSAAPKQVIVRIENLMNVQNIDLTDERKTAVLANLKDEVATLLLDVVQDFNANMS